MSIHEQQAKEHRIQVNVRNFMNNRLLKRRQMTVEVVHPHRGTVPKNEVRERLQQMFKKYVKDINQISVFDFKTSFGGGRSTGFALVYDDFQTAKRVEPWFRLYRFRAVKKRNKRRRNTKDNKARNAPLRGWDKTRPLTKTKK